MRCKLCMVVLMGALCFPVSGCRKKRPEAPNLMDPTVKLSYAFGHDMGEQLRHRKDRIDFRAFMQGVEDAYMGRPPAIPAAEMERLKAEALRRAEEQRARYLKQIAEKNLQESRKFLEENARREGVRTTASGLQYVVLKEGDGPRPTDGRVSPRPSSSCARAASTGCLCRRSSPMERRESPLLSAPTRPSSSRWSCSASRNRGLRPGSRGVCPRRASGEGEA